MVRTSPTYTVGFYSALSTHVQAKLALISMKIQVYWENRSLIQVVAAEGKFLILKAIVSLRDSFSLV